MGVRLVLVRMTATKSTRRTVARTMSVLGRPIVMEEYASALCAHLAPATPMAPKIEL